MNRHRRHITKLLAWAVLACIVFPSRGSAQGYTITPPPFQTVLDNGGNIVNGACVWTYVAGTTTPIATYSDTAGTPNLNPIRSDSAGRFTAYLIPGNTYKFIYETTCTPPSTHGTVLRTADNISAAPTSSAVVDVTAMAGEALAAGNCAYMSAGDGGKTVGQWYKCDAASTYSSITNWVGIAPASIAGASTGSIRISGSVTGLGGFSAGSVYYVGTAGALTATSPANVRRIGQADSSTSIVVSPNPPPPIAVPLTPFACGRLTLTTAVPVTTTDVLAATTLYYTPISGCNLVTLYNGTTLITDTLTETSIAVPASASQMYDVFAFDNAGAPTLELLAWTSDTARATAVTLQNGFLAKAATPARRYIGSFRTTAVSGQTEDSLAKRYVWNYYNRVSRQMLVQEATDSWNYTTATIRQARASTADQLDCVIGIAEVRLHVDILAHASNGAANPYAAVGVGEDSTTAFTAGGRFGGFVLDSTVTQIAQLVGTLDKYPTIGRHFYSWNEYSGASGTTTWYGDNGGAILQSGIAGWIEG